MKNINNELKLMIKIIYDEIKLMIKIINNEILARISHGEWALRHLFLLIV